MRTKYVVGKVKNSTESILKRTILDFFLFFGCAIASDRWTNCQKCLFINLICIFAKDSIFLDTVDTSLKQKIIPYL